MIRKLISCILFLFLAVSVTAQLGPGSFSTVTTQKFRVGANATYITDTKITSIGADSTSTTKYATIRAITAWANGRLAELYNNVTTNALTVLRLDVTITPPTTLAPGVGYCTDVTLTGAVIGDAVYVAKGSSGAAGMYWSARVTTTNQVNICGYDLTNNGITGGNSHQIKLLILK